MEAAKIIKAWKSVKFHAKVVWRGFYRTLYGALIAGLIAMAIYGFVSLSAETGWVAVWDFVASFATLIVAVSNMYMMGAHKKGGKRG